MHQDERSKDEERQNKTPQSDTDTTPRVKIYRGGQKWQTMWACNPHIQEIQKIHTMKAFLYGNNTTYPSSLKANGQHFRGHIFLFLQGELPAP